MKTIYYAVTNQYSIIPLQVVSRVDNPFGDTEIYTEIIGDKVGDHERIHHRYFFKHMWLTDGGKPDNAQVFTTKEDACCYAVKEITNDIVVKQSILEGLYEKLDSLCE